MNPFSHYYYDFLDYCSCEVGKKDWSEDIEGAAEEYDVSNHLKESMLGLIRMDNQQAIYVRNRILEFFKSLSTSNNLIHNIIYIF